MIFEAKLSLCDINAKIIVCEENKMKYRALNANNSNVYKFQIDGGIITNQTVKKCDYIVENDSKNNIYFVELKGCDISQAYKQIKQTISFCKSKILPDSMLHSRIICSRISTHSVHDGNYRELKKICSDIIVHRECLEESI